MLDMMDEDRLGHAYEDVRAAGGGGGPSSTGPSARGERARAGGYKR
jgi:hypothetical protein